MTLLRVGLNVDSTELKAALTSFPNMASSRVFGGPGKGIPSWTSAIVATLRKAGVVPHFSFKDWTDDATATAMVIAWLDAMPADVLLAILTWHHEPEGDEMDSYEYRRRYVLLAKIIAEHKNGKRIRLRPIHTWYPSMFKIGDKYNTDWTKWVGVWQQWVPLDAKGKYVGDAIGFDCYVPVTAKAYPLPIDFFRIPVAAAHALNVPLAIPEFGSLRIPSDTTGTGRAKFIMDSFHYLTSVNAVQVNWWNTTGKGGYNYRLDDKPSAAAWNKIIAASNV